MEKKKHFPFWKNPNRTPYYRKSDYNRNCHTCYYEGVMKLDDRQLIKCMLCLNHPSRPGWVDKVHMMRIQGRRRDGPLGKKILGL